MSGPVTPRVPPPAPPPEPAHGHAHPHPPAGDCCAPPAVAATGVTLQDEVIAVLKTCFDPEIPINIYDLSLIYGIDVDPARTVHIRMTLTSPACPVAGTLPGEVQQKVASIAAVGKVDVELVWDPPWDIARLSEAAKLTLGIG